MMKFLTAAALSAAMVVPTVAAPAQVWDAPVAWQNGNDGYFQQAGWRDRRGRWHRGARYNQRCYDKGNGGLAIGGIVGALAGREIAGRGDRTLGTILGAGAGALAGRAIDKSDGAPCYRR